MLERHRIRLVPPAEVTACETCGQGYIEDRQFVAFDNNPGGDFAPGLIHTKDEQAGQISFRRRDIHAGGDVVTTVVHLPMLCSDCLRAAGGEIGLDDTAPYAAELEETRQERDKLRQQLADCRAECIEIKNSLTVLTPVAQLIDQAAERLEEKRSQPKPARSKKG